jgi:hypothetical protein
MDDGGGYGSMTELTLLFDLLKKLGRKVGMFTTDDNNGRSKLGREAKMEALLLVIEGGAVKRRRMMMERRSPTTWRIICQARIGNIEIGTGLMD